MTEKGILEKIKRYTDTQPFPPTYDLPSKKRLKKLIDKMLKEAYYVG